MKRILLFLALTTSFQGHAQLTKSRKIAGWSCIAVGLIASCVSLRYYLISNLLWQQFNIKSELFDQNKGNVNQATVLLGEEAFELGKKAQANNIRSIFFGLLIALPAFLISMNVLFPIDSEIPDIPVPETT